MLAVVNGPYGGAKVQGYLVEKKTGNTIRHIAPPGKALSNPHDVFISQNATDIYIVEIGPNKIWKFTQGIITTPNTNFCSTCTIGCPVLCSSIFQTVEESLKNLAGWFL